MPVLRRRESDSRPLDPHSLQELFDLATRVLTCGTVLINRAKEGGPFPKETVSEFYELYSEYMRYYAGQHVCDFWLTCNRPHPTAIQVSFSFVTSIRAALFPHVAFGGQALTKAQLQKSRRSWKTNSNQLRSLEPPNVAEMTRRLGEELWVALQGLQVQEQTAVFESTGVPGSSLAPQYVTLSQAAAIVNKGKKTLQREKNKPTSDMPSPDVEGGGGQADEWLWDRMRPWLEKKYRRKLPGRFPSSGL